MPGCTRSKDLPLAAAADEDGPLGAEGERTGARHLFRIDGDAEAGGELDVGRPQLRAAAAGADRQTEYRRNKKT